MRKHYKSSVAGLALLASLATPAAAATIAQIPGGGTGGNIALHGGSGAAIVGTIDTAIPAGGFVVAGASIRTTSGTNAVTGAIDTRGNSWTCLNSIAINANGGVCYSKIVNALSIGDTIQINFNVSGLCDIIAFALTNVAATSPLDPASPAPASGSGTIMNVGTTGVLALGGANEVLVGMTSMNIGGTQTPPIGWTDLGTSTSNQLHMAFELVTLTTPVNYTDTSTVSNTWSGLLSAFISAGGAVAKNSLMFHAVP